MSQQNKDRKFALLITVVVILGSQASVLYLQSLGILTSSWQALLIAFIFIALGSVAWIQYKRNQGKNIKFSPKAQS
jgi:hypothetical protein